MMLGAIARRLGRPPVMALTATATPDIRFVVHYDFPGSPEAYYQEAGRAGRDGQPARCSILYNTLLKRHEAVREHRGGLWERLAPDVTQVDLRGRLADYEARRNADREKLAAMEGYCRTARCRTRHLLEYFGDEPAPGWTCGHCDNDAEAAVA